VSLRAYFAGRFTAQEARREAELEARALGVGGPSFTEPTYNDHVDTHAAIPYERDVQAAILKYLSFHRGVAWAHRFNTGGMTDDRGNHVRFAFTGCSDIIGQLANGLFLAIEVKRPGKRPTKEQQAFLDTVKRAGGCAFYASCIEDVTRELGSA
jgi:hypothetical protein